MKKIKLIKCNEENPDWVISYFPDDYKEMIYLEPFCGGANVFLNKNKSQIEILNDNKKEIIQIFHALRDESKEFIKRLSHYKYCESTFNKALKKTEFEDYLDEAINEFILIEMSKNGLKKSFIAKNDWKNQIKNLSVISERISNTYIFNKSALEIVKIFNQKDVLVYCDPPYLYETKTSKTVYESEMDIDEHIALSHLLNNFKGKVIISGSVSPLYKRLYKNWNFSKNKAGSKAKCLWKNF